jgi:hypothetical protein
MNLNTKTIKTTLLAVALAAALPASAELSAITFQPDLKLPSIPGGVALWFNSVMRPKNLPVDVPVTVCITNQVVSVKVGRDTTLVSVPDALVSFKPWESQAQVYFDANWSVSVPSTSPTTGDVFMSGASEPVAQNFSSTPIITWTADFATDRAGGLSLDWKFGTGSYAMFSDSENALGVVGADERFGDKSGAPVNFKPYVATGLASTDPLRYVGKRSPIANVTAAQSATCGGVY